MGGNPAPDSATSVPVDATLFSVGPYRFTRWSPGRAQRRRASPPVSNIRRAAGRGAPRSIASSTASAAGVGRKETVMPRSSIHRSSAVGSLRTASEGTCRAAPAASVLQTSIMLTSKVGLETRIVRSSGTRSIRWRNLAYVIFTSGSTGQPKGVAVPLEG
ncbi:MAG TPA: AMP-binding protein, partial [Longimicrobium sp.]|nr:AMP-binding protein [Longimicrobium sp.]